MDLVVYTPEEIDREVRSHQYPLSQEYYEKVKRYMSEEIEIARQWLANARNDLLNADNNLKSEQIPFDTVCFQCHQAAEKLLKSYLVGNGQEHPITHDLLLILEKAIPLNSESEILRDWLAILMPYSVEFRYPLMIGTCQLRMMRRKREIRPIKSATTSRVNLRKVKRKI